MSPRQPVLLGKKNEIANLPTVGCDKPEVRAVLILCWAQASEHTVWKLGLRRQLHLLPGMGKIDMLTQGLIIKLLGDFSFAQKNMFRSDIIPLGFTGGHLQHIEGHAMGQQKADFEGQRQRCIWYGADPIWGRN